LFFEKTDYQSSGQREDNTAIKNMDQTGFLWVPIPQLLPYLREVDTLFQDEINHDKFRLKGDRIFEVGT
jgi:hypothetical protein